MDINSPSKRLRRSAAPADASGGRKRRGAGGGVDSETALDQFARDWRDLESGLPFWARVRMEGVDPGALPLRKALWTAVGYLTKWARCSFQCPSSVRSIEEAVAVEDLCPSTAKLLFPFRWRRTSRSTAKS